MLKFGIVAAGAIVKDFLQDFSMLSNVTVASLYSRTYEKAVNFCQQHNITHTSQSIEELLERCDVVYIASLNNSHFEYIMKALNHGKHVLCEKPICINSKQLEQAYHLANSKNLILMEAQRLWTHKALNHLKKIIDEKSLGDILSIEASLGSFGQRLDRRTLECGGGALMDLGVYPLFAFLYLIGFPDNSLVKSCFFDTGVDGFTSILLNKGDCIGSLSSSFLINTRGELRVCGTKGEAVIPKIFTISDTLIVTPYHQKPKLYTLPLTGLGLADMIQEFCSFVDGSNLDQYKKCVKISKQSSQITDQIRRDISLDYPFE